MQLIKDFNCAIVLKIIRKNSVYIPRREAGIEKAREKPMMAIEKDMDQRAGPSIPLCGYWEISITCWPYCTTGRQATMYLSLHRTRCTIVITWYVPWWRLVMMLPPLSRYPALNQTLLMRTMMMTLRRYLQAVRIHSRYLMYVNHCTATHVKVLNVTTCWRTLQAVVAAQSTNNQWTGDSEMILWMVERLMMYIIAIIPVWNPDMIITGLTL